MEWTVHLIGTLAHPGAHPDARHALLDHPAPSGPPAPGGMSVRLLRRGHRFGKVLTKSA